QLQPARHERHAAGEHRFHGFHRRHRGRSRFRHRHVIALALRFGRGSSARFLGRIYIVPLFIPSVIASYAMITFLANHGFVDGLLQALGLPDGLFPKIVFDWKGIVITQVWLSLPFMTVLLSSVLLEISDSLIESARDVGASTW